MASCRACPGPLGDADRYCSRCGAAVANDIEVFGVDQALTERARVLRTGPRPVLLLAVGGVAALVALVWVLSSAASDDAAATADPDRSNEAGPTDESDERSVPRLGAPEDETADTAESDAAVESGSLEAERRDETSTTEEDGDAKAAGPVLGREVGWSLWYGSSNRLRKIDLDTGEITEYDIRGTPVHADGGWLVLRGSNFSSLDSVPIDDPDGREPVELAGSENTGFPLVRGEEPGTAWLLAGSFDDLRIKLVRLADGEVLSEFESTPLFFWLAGGVPLLIATADGGIFERNGTSFQKVADGGLIAAGDDHVLISRCSSPTACRLEWLDRPSFEPIDRPVPSGSSYFNGWLSPRGRVLAVSDWGAYELFDVERGHDVELEIEVFEPTAFAVSPDERYLATAQGPVRIHDLDTGEVIELDIGFSETVVLTANA
ncbi:MAG: hypothetical protein OEV40_07035 [Acidimicrobiia bacterium]|nr:hypothetical protein [Acidimicrobiia bacterium]